MIHNECRGVVLVDVTSSYRMLANVTQNGDSSGLRTTEIHVYNVKDDCSDLIFWCLTCDDEVSLDNIEFSCRGCNNPVSIEDGRVALDTGGIWCDNCIQSRCDGESCVSLSEIYATNLVALT